MRRNVPNYRPPRQLTMANVQVDSGLRDAAHGLNSMVRELNSTVMVLPRLIKMFERLSVAVGLLTAANTAALAGRGARGIVFIASTLSRVRAEAGSYNTVQGYMNAASRAQAADALAARSTTSASGAGTGLLARGGSLLRAVGGGSMAVGGAAVGVAAALVAATVATNKFTAAMTRAGQSGIGWGRADERFAKAKADFESLDPNSPNRRWYQGWIGRAGSAVGREIRKSWQQGITGSSEGYDKEAALSRNEKLQLYAARMNAAMTQRDILANVQGPRRMGFSSFEQSWNTMASQLAEGGSQQYTKEQLSLLRKSELHLAAIESKILDTGTYMRNDSGEVTKHAFPSLGIFPMR